MQCAFMSHCSYAYISNTNSFAQEYDAESEKMVGSVMVAKEGKQEGEPDLQMDFHKIFARTQITAFKIARGFNQKLRQRLSIINPVNDRGMRMWEIYFLHCSMYAFMSGGVERCVLVEKMLPYERYTKWNGNNGYVHVRKGNPKMPAPRLPVRRFIPAIGLAKIAPIMEGNEEEDDGGGGGGGHGDDGSDDAVSVESGCGDEAVENDMQLETPGECVDVGGDFRKRSWNVGFTFKPQAEDFLQAFSHFSFWNSGHKLLVCDLQGVMFYTFDDAVRAGVFELTDPVIHYKSATGRKQVYGKTDLGKKGIQRFFETHECNDVCRLLGLLECSIELGERKHTSKRRKVGLSNAGSHPEFPQHTPHHGGCEPPI